MVVFENVQGRTQMNVHPKYEINERNFIYRLNGAFLTNVAS